MDNIFNSIILAFLGVMSIREVIASTGIIPRNRKYSWIFYNNYERSIVEETLREIGIDKGDLVKTIKRKRNFNNDSIVSELNLLEIISKYIISTEKKMKYGGSIPIQTQFYISSVEASYDSIYLGWMCALLNNLVIGDINNGQLHKFPDFIITPKGGNNHLGRVYADNNQSIFITSKYSNINSYVQFLKGDFEYELKTNYEGSWTIFKKQSIKGEKLSGIVVDCNTTTGLQIIETVENFNRLCKDLNLNVMPVTRVYTLYRPITNNEFNIDIAFSSKGLTLIRYMDLSEAVKTQIVAEKMNEQELSVYKQKDRKALVNLYNMIVQEDELRC